MLGFILRFIQDGNRGDEVTVKREFHGDFVVLFGIVQRVRRLSQAWVRLEKAGFGIEARMLVRAALEHAVTAQWVFYTEDGVDRMRRSGALDQLNLARDLRASEERLRTLEGSLPAGPAMPAWGQIMTDLDDPTGFIKQSYRVLSQIVHVTHSTILDGLDIGDDGRLSVRMEPEVGVEQEVLYALTGACLLAAWLLAVMSGDAAQQQRLRERGVELHMPWRLDHHLPDQRRRAAGPPPEPSDALALDP
jgi:hypothetical protein